MKLILVITIQANLKRRKNPVLVVTFQKNTIYTVKDL